MWRNPFLLICAGLGWLAPEVLGQVTGPSLGLVFDSATASLRPILGVPGAATMGDPIALDLTLARAAISPQQDYALAVSQDNAAVLLVRQVEDSWQAQAIAGALAAPDLVALSPEGGSAALYSHASGRLQVLTGLPAAPAISRDVAVNDAFTALAVNEDGSAVVAALPDGDAFSLYLLVTEAERRWLLSARGIAALRFAGKNRDLLVTDPTGNAIYLIRDMSETVLLASERDGVLQPVAAETIPGGTRIAIANASGSIVIVDPSGGPPVTLDCGCAPTGLGRMAGASVLRLTEPSNAPISLLDTGAGEPRLVMVPPVAGGRP